VQCITSYLNVYVPPSTGTDCADRWLGKVDPGSWLYIRIDDSHLISLLTEINKLPVKHTKTEHQDNNVKKFIS